MKFPSVLLAVGCLLSAAAGQWVEKTIGLPDSVPILRDPDSTLYNLGSNTLFVGGSNGLAVVDGLSNRRISLVPLTDFYSGIACCASQVNKVYWAGGANLVYSFDGASGRVLGRVSVYLSYGMCYNPVVNRVYAMGWSASPLLTVINAANDSIARIMHLGPNATSICCNPGDNKVYFASRTARTVSVIDCSVDSIKRVISVSGEPEVVVYNPSGNKVYSCGYDTLTIIDGHSDNVIGRVLLPARPTRAAYSSAANKLYCADSSGVSVVCGSGDTLLARLGTPRSVTGFVFDSTDNLMWCKLASTDTLIAIDGQGDTLCGAVAAGDYPYAFCYNPARNRLYATQNYVAVIDPAAKRVDQRILLNFTPTALCAARTLDKVYCAGLNEASVAVVSTLQNRVTGFVPVGHEPRALAYDSPLGLLACANYHDSTVSIIACNRDSVTGTVRIGHMPELLCVDTVLHKAWCRFSNGIAVIDLRAESLEAVMPVPGSEALLADPAHGRVWCATGSDGHVVVLDAAGDSIIADIPVGGSPSVALCLLPDANLVCCATQSNDAVAVIDGATNHVFSIIPVGDHPLALLHNPRRNKLYCANVGSSDVTVIDCNTLTPVATIAVGASPAALAYDSTGDRVYCAGSGSGHVAVISCKRDTMVASIHVGDNPVALAYASPQRRMYVANQDGSSLTVIRDSVRMGVEEGMKDEGGRMNVGPTVVRGVLRLSSDECRVSIGGLLDIGGRKVLDLKSGPNDVSGLAPGVYFVRQAQAQAQAQAVRKVVIAR